MTAENTENIPASNNEQVTLSVEAIEKIAQQVAQIMSQMAQKNIDTNQTQNALDKQDEVKASTVIEPSKTAKDFIAKPVPLEISRDKIKSGELGGAAVKVDAPVYDQAAIVDHVLTLTRDIEAQKKAAEAEALKIREEIKAKETEKQNQAKLAKYSDLIKNEKISKDKLLVSDDAVLDTMLKDLKILNNMKKTMPSAYMNEPSKTQRMTEDQKAFRSLFEPEKSK
jgi:hypothetical protein